MPTSSLVAAVEALLRGDTNVAALPLLSVDQDQALLTEREEEVVRLIASGRQNKEIAAQLDISYHTVRTHVQHAMAKLGLSHRHALASWAQQHLVEGRPAVRDTS
jgi:DNA-binding CsgD family transcriptional regulator